MQWHDWWSWFLQHCTYKRRKARTCGVHQLLGTCYQTFRPRRYQECHGQSVAICGNKLRIPPLTSFYKLMRLYFRFFLRRSSKPMLTSMTILMKTVICVRPLHFRCARSFFRDISFVVFILLHHQVECTLTLNPSRADFQQQSEEWLATSAAETQVASAEVVLKLFCVFCYLLALESLQLQVFTIVWI